MKSTVIGKIMIATTLTLAATIASTAMAGTYSCQNKANDSDTFLLTEVVMGGDAVEHINLVIGNGDTAGSFDRDRSPVENGFISYSGNIHGIMAHFMRLATMKVSGTMSGNRPAQNGTVLLDGNTFDCTSIFVSRYNKILSASKVLATCSSGDDQTELKIIQEANGQLKAKMTVQSVGDSYPTYTYDVSEVAAPAHTLGAPKTFEGKGFKLSILVDTAPRRDGTIMAHLDADLSATPTVFCALK